MALSEIQRADVNRRLSAFCDARVPPAVQDRVRVGFRIKGTEVVLFEERPGFQRPEKVARAGGREVPLCWNPEAMASVLSASGPALAFVRGSADSAELPKAAR